MAMLQLILLLVVRYVRERPLDPEKFKATETREESNDKTHQGTQMLHVI